LPFAICKLELGHYHDQRAFETRFSGFFGLAVPTRKMFDNP